MTVQAVLGVCCLGPALRVSGWTLLQPLLRGALCTPWNMYMVCEVMKRITSLLKASALVLFIIFAMAACNDDPVDISQVYETPTAKGRIVLPSGSGLSYSDIYVRVEETGNQYQVASDGTWVISGLEEGVGYTLYFQDEPFLDISSRDLARDGGGHHGHYGGRKDNVYGSKGEGTDNGIVQIKKTASVSGCVTTSDNSSLLGIDVYVPGTSYMAKTAEDGSFTLSGLPDGQYSIVASKYGYITAYSEPFTVITSAEEDTLITLGSELNLIPGTGTVQGSIVYEGSTSSTSRPASIYLQKEDDPSVGQTVMSDENGLYNAGGLVPGVYTITVTPSSYYTVATRTGIEVDAAIVTVVDPIVLTANGGSFKGTVTTHDAKTVTGASILLTSLSGSQSYYTGVSSDGSFTISNVVPGNYRYTVTLDGYEPYEGQAAISAATSFEINAVLQAGLGAVSGKVFLEGADIYSGITVTLVSLRDGSISYTTTTRDDGSFDITGIKEAGSYQVRVSLQGYVSNNSQTVSVKTGQVATVPDITLASVQAVVRGSVELEGAASHEGVLILLKNNSNQYTATTAQDGSFALSGVVPGTYTLLASKSGYNSNESTPFSVEPSSDKTLSPIMLQIGVRSITGTVKLELSDDNSGALVTATNLAAEGDVTSAITNSDGVFSLAGLVPGQYLISISKPGYRSMTLETVDVMDSKPVTLEPVTLPIARGGITGIVRLEGWTDYSGIKVELIGTEYVAETADDGSYDFSVPSGNYPGGVRFSKEDFETASDTNTITVLTDSTYSVADRELRALATTVRGRIDVLNTDDEGGVLVSLADTPFSMTTGADGSFEFKHVPLGSYRLEAERENTPLVTQEITLQPCPVLDLGTITMIPNSASLIGNVSLDGMSNHGGIKVTAVPDDSSLPTQSTTTDAGGSFYIGNVVSVGNYTVRFEKAGWDSQEIEVSDLMPLEVRDITAENPVTLYDTTAPVLSSVVINDGANTAVDRNVRITLRASDEGSGVSKMQYCFDNRFDETVTMRDYMGSFGVAMPMNNGEKTIYVTVYDASGNASSVMSATVTLIDQKTEVSGIMSGDNLKWTKDKSPYLVTGSVYVEEGTTLTIEPGVDVQFNGPFNIYVEGVLKAEGTPSERIKFYGIDEGKDAWEGINVANDDLTSTLNNVDIYDAAYGLIGSPVVYDSTVDAAYALGVYDYTGVVRTFRGILHNVKVSGDANIQDAFFDGVVIGGHAEVDWSVMFNTLFLEDVVSDASTFIYCTFEDAVEFSDIFSPGVTAYYCAFEELVALDDIRYYATINYSDFTDCNGISVSSPRAYVDTFDFRSNFWGYDKTREMDECTNGNVSFINDFFDQNFNVARVDYSDYFRDPLLNIGYQGEDFSPAIIPNFEYVVGSIGELGGTVVYVDEEDEYDDWNHIEATRFEPMNLLIPFGYFRDDSNSVNKMVGTSAELGSGKENTEKLVAAMGDTAYLSPTGDEKGLYVARFASLVDTAGFDWYLPSIDEGVLIQESKNGVYISSTEEGEERALGYWYDANIGTVNTGSYEKNNSCYVALIRYF